MIARRWALAGVLLCGLWGMGAANAQQCVTVSNVDVAATQNFDSLSNVAGSTTNALDLPGWSLIEAGGGARDNEQYAVDTGGSNTGDTYSYGAAGASDRALGSLRSGTLVPAYGACYTNNTGAAIQSLDIAYNGEQWRLGTAGRADQLDFQYSLDATSLATGAWTNVDALDFASPVTTGSVGARDGNAAGNRTSIGGSITGLSIPNGATFWVRWNDADASGADDGLAVDDFSLTARGQGGGGLPTVTIADVQAAEGNAGTTTFEFTVSLNTAATAPVSVAYATADGTATTADNDYVAASGTLTIPAGSSSATISVLVNGDATVEPDETFVVNLSAPVGAIITDAQGVGTIVNDDVSVVAIHAIQGAGGSSPLAGQGVTTRGIVTARKFNGFYLQAPEAEYDADPATSEGVFVYTGAAPPAQAAVGNLVQVSGNVVEYRPANSTDPGTLTEITGPGVSLLGTGQALPAPVALTLTFPDPAGAYDQLERVEGMRVSAASVTVVAATGGSKNESNATGSSDGKFGVVVTGHARPFREPGIRAPDNAPGGGSIPPIPRWDGNPEGFAVDSDALGAAGSGFNLSAGAVVANLVGTLDYADRTYIVDAGLTEVTQGPAASAARAPEADEFTYASYNLERFFDASNDPAIGEPVLTPVAFSNRLAKASLGIRNYLHAPDILGVVEVENLSTLQALAARVSSDAIAAGQPDPLYVAYLQEGNDVGGIDVGFLVKTAPVATGTPRVAVQEVQQLGKDFTWTEPGGGSSLLNDRPPLQLDAVVHFADGSAFPLTAIQVHQRSLNDAEADNATGARVRAKRQRQAEYLAEQIDALQDADPSRRILVGGDFNAFEFNDGLVDAMGVVTGLPSPDNATAVPGDGADLVSEDLLNLYVEEPEDQRYSFEFDGSVQSLDHILVNQALAASAGAVGLDHARINADFPEIARTDATTVTRLADHDPAIAYFSLASADLSITASAAPASVEPGASVTFTATVANGGPGSAASPGVGFAFDAELPGLAVTAPAGWSCDAPTIGAGTTQVACSGTTLASGATAAFSLVASAPASEAGGNIALSASVEVQTFDPNLANNNAAASVSVSDAGLVLSITGPATVPASQFNVDYVLQLRNTAQRAAGQPRLVIDGNTLASTAAITAPAGWTCVKQQNGGPRSVTITCSAASLAAGAVANFGLRVNARPTPANRQITVSGVAASTLAGDNLGDNSASFTTEVR